MISQTFSVLSVVLVFFACIRILLYRFNRQEKQKDTKSILVSSFSATHTLSGLYHDLLNYEFAATHGNWDGSRVYYMPREQESGWYMPLHAFVELIASRYSKHHAIVDARHRYWQYQHNSQSNSWPTSPLQESPGTSLIKAPFRLAADAYYYLRTPYPEFSEASAQSAKEAADLFSGALLLVKRQLLPGPDQVYSCQHRVRTILQCLLCHCIWGPTSASALIEQYEEQIKADLQIVEWLRAKSQKRELAQHYNLVKPGSELVARGARLLVDALVTAKYR